MKIRLLILLLVFSASFVSCQSIVDRAADDIAEQVSGEVVEQLSTVVAEQVSTAVAAAPPTATIPVGDGETVPVLRVVDGDTIDVLIDGVNTRIRYLQMNTPERNEPCSRESTRANIDLVQGKAVRLVPDEEDQDRYGRLLRFVYVADVLVNRVLVEEGYAEVVLYPPNDAHYEEFRALEAAAAQAGRGCHATGIFDDGSKTR